MITTVVSCDMSKSCKNPVTHIDEKGFVYCSSCGFDRKLTRRCRKLRPWELAIILASGHGGAVSIYYEKVSKAEYEKRRKASDEKAKTIYANSQVIVLMERDGHEIYFHGAVAAPFWVTDADTEARKIFRSVAEASPESGDNPWDYDDVLRAFSNADWTVLNAGRLWEADALYG